MSIKWRDEMAVDHGVIDHDHQALITIINDFSDANPQTEALSSLLSILDRLDHYTKIHFDREEKLQAAVQYPYVSAHHHEHVDLIKRLAAIRDGLASFAGTDARDDTAPPADAPADSGANVAPAHAEIAEFLHRWLIDHVVKSDLRMKPFADAMKQHTAQLKPLFASTGPRSNCTARS